MTPEQVAAINVRNDMIGACFWVFVGMVIFFTALDYILQRRRKG